MAEPPYNPLDKLRLGESVARALLGRPVAPLPPPDRFEGAGIYAIYYTGTFVPYVPVAEVNRGGQFSAPIYVGKAVPAGTRKGGHGLGASAGNVLYRRLGEHADSIQEAANLNIADFSCRYLAVDDIWIPLGEALLIEWFSPLWNTVLDGFGNHDPGKGRYNQERSAWDVVHPGRAWAERCSPHHRSRDGLLSEIATALNKQGRV